MQRSRQLQERIEHKRAELQHLTQIRDYTETVTNQLGELQEQLDQVVDGTESVALVLSVWQTVVRSISLASIGLQKYSQQDFENGKPLPESLIRLVLDPNQYEQSEVDEESEQ
ncbi:DASH complex subunit Dad2p [[Candida] jaroonii]|uniref:DASH complex subunit Dad2p n=1 Tax=[Candida] jaroonii TaxID=467808 RepID=A0ACA9Y353_9ASCO|nr:DASH complex subunit Dad2p [[Candida] jaroonii]